MAEQQVLKRKIKRTNEETSAIRYNGKRPMIEDTALTPRILFSPKYAPGCNWINQRSPDKSDPAVLWAAKHSASAMKIARAGTRRVWEALARMLLRVALDTWEVAAENETQNQMFCTHMVVLLCSLATVRDGRRRRIRRGRPAYLLYVQIVRRPPAYSIEDNSSMLENHETAVLTWFSQHI